MAHKLNEAFSAVARVNFLPDNVKDRAEYDVPLPIGYGQTNSQPYTVRKMLEWLEPQPGEKILDVGSGSGWTTALLGYLVGRKGSVTAVEIVPELVTFGAEKCKKVNIKNVQFYQAESGFGWQKDAPYDRILVSAAAHEIPKVLVDQLKQNGRLVVPVKNSILVIDKKATGELAIQEHPGFVFVPLLPSE